ncbi:MAG: mechanosensitive ion channel family protein, partial [Gemmatimonadota bacterium]|nr:mechanosensitive ion channel family protein [Gemmatimonadota bacterium]
MKRPRSRWVLLVLLSAIVGGCQRAAEEGGALPPDTSAITDAGPLAVDSEETPAGPSAADAALPPTADRPDSGRADLLVPGTTDQIDAQATRDSLITLVLGLSARIDSLVAADNSEARQDSASTEVTFPEAPKFRFVGMRVFWTLFVLAATALAVRSFAFVLEALAERNAERRLFYKRLVPLVRLLSWIIATIVVARVVWSVDAQGLVAAGAAGAVAIGFAAQDILKNVFGGLVIVADRPFAAGDKVRVGQTYGEVVSVGLWSTRITTPDDNLVSVPNSQVVNGQVANANSGALDCQVVTDLYVPGWVDERLAKKIAYEAAASSPFVYLHKPILVLVRDVYEQTFLTNL